jgi:three-Cys-motif partner protein
MIEPAGLFDSVPFREAATSSRAKRALDTALALDRESRLRRYGDGLLAREVAMHSLDKAHLARYYADIVGDGMKKAWPGPLAWVELFAGPGMLYVRELEDYKPGSALDALRSIRTRFDIYVFVDLDPRCADSLERRVGHEPGVHVRCGDANAAATHDQIVELIPRDALVVLYADPAGLDLDFNTLRFFADRYEHLDLLLNFPVPGIDRALSAGQQTKAARVLNHPSPVELIGPGSGRAGVSLRQWFERQLGALGYREFDAKTIRLYENNSPLYDLMLASRNPRAKKFFQEAMKRGPGGQYALDLRV